MKKIYLVIKKEITRNKKLTIILITMLILGFIFGTLFITILKSNDKELVTNSITNFFNNAKLNKLDNTNMFINSLISNIFYISFIFILGISIIGIPIILLILFIKSFVLGFSISSIFLTYNLKGMILSFLYIFPHQIIYFILLIFISLYGMYISLSLYKVIFSKKEVNFRILIKRYFVIFLACIFICILLSLFEAFITSKIINLFSFLLK